MIANVQCLFPDRLHQNQTRTARMATRQHLSNQANQAGVCFVLNEYSDDPDTSAFLVGQHVPSLTEPTDQIPLTPTAAAAVDVNNTATFDVPAMDRGRVALRGDIVKEDSGAYAVFTEQGSSASQKTAAKVMDFI